MTSLGPSVLWCLDRLSQAAQPMRTSPHRLPERGHTSRARALRSSPDMSLKQVVRPVYDMVCTTAPHHGWWRSVCRGLQVSPLSSLDFDFLPSMPDRERRSSTSASMKPGIRFSPGAFHPAACFDEARDQLSAAGFDPVLVTTPLPRRRKRVQEPL